MDTPPSYELPPEDSELLARLKAEFAPRTRKAIKRTGALGPYGGLFEPGSRQVRAIGDAVREIERSFSGHATAEVRPLIQSLCVLRELASQALADERLELFDVLQRHITILSDTLNDIRRRFRAKPPPMTDEEAEAARRQVYRRTELARRRFARRMMKGTPHEPTNP